MSFLQDCNGGAVWYMEQRMKKIKRVLGNEMKSLE
jgi:hypothetical protein